MTNLTVVQNDAGQVICLRHDTDTMKHMVSTNP
jgi:hypothetical protein